MADDLAQPIDPFEAELTVLAQLLVEGGASPQEAVAAASQVAQEARGQSPVGEATSRLPRPQRATVGAGQYGLPAMPPLASPNALAGQAELRSANSPLADYVVEKTGVTGLGPATDLTAKIGRATGDAVANATMIPWAVQSGAQLGEAATRFDPSELLPSSAQAQEVDKLQQLLEAQALMTRQAEEARQRREGMRPRGRAPTPQLDPQYTAADAEYRQISDRLTAHNELVRQEQTIRSPEYQLKMQKEREAAEEAKRAREANTPWRERNPALANALPNYVMALSAGVPGAIGMVRNLRTFFPGSVQGQMRSAIAENALARSSGDASRAAITEAELANHLAAMPQGWKAKMGKEAGEASMAAGAGGALTAEASMFPDQWDAYNLPDGERKEKARELALNPLNYIERGAMGALTGFSGYEVGSKLTPWRGANASRAKAIVDNPYSPPLPDRPAATPPTSASHSPAAPDAKVVTKVKGKDGVVRYHGDKGHFTGNPKKPRDDE